VLASLVDDGTGLLQAVEDFSVEQFVAQFAVEAFAIAVLPRAAGLNVKSFWLQALRTSCGIFVVISAPLSDRMCSGTPLASITSAIVSVTPKLLIRRATRIARQLPCELVDQGQESKPGPPWVCASTKSELRIWLGRSGRNRLQFPAPAK
jgi:hypothetical protein